MMWKYLVLVVLPLLVLGNKDYTGYKVIRITPRVDRDITFIKSLRDRIGESIDFWQEARALNRPVDIMLSPHQLEKVNKLLQIAGIEPSVMIHNVQEAIDLQKASGILNPSADFTNTYYNLNEIDDWITDFVNRNGDGAVKVSLEYLGNTYEGKAMEALKFLISSTNLEIKLSYGGGSNAEADFCGFHGNQFSTVGSNKPSIFFYGGLHAREWITPAVMMNIAEFLISDYNSGRVDVTKSLNEMDFYMIPVVNKDGYEYSWNSDRMWRKTRSKNAGAICDGVDPNRNWDSNFGGAGADSWACSDAYHGPFPFSEVETQNLRDFILKLQSEGELKLFMDVHAYGQYWMIPYGYTRMRTADNAELMDSCKKSVDAIAAVYGTQFQHGSIASTIYVASGSSVDWTYDSAGIKHSYALELRDTGSSGFLLPAEQIYPTAVETFEGFMSTVIDACGSKCS